MPLSDAEIVKDLAAYVQQAAREDAFSGAVLLAKDGQTLFRAAYGLADRNTKQPNTVATRFNLGSMNKMFTAVAVVQLAEQGKVAFTDKVGKYLPEYPNPQVAREVTIHHLLTHIRPACCRAGRLKATRPGDACIGRRRWPEEVSRPVAGIAFIDEADRGRKKYASPPHR